MTFSKVDQGKGTVKVESILGSQFAAAPVLSSPDRVTLLEEDKIVAYYGGGILYAEPSRQEPLL
jgi:photosynthetic reaction center H subunit